MSRNGERARAIWRLALGLTSLLAAPIVDLRVANAFELEPNEYVAAPAGTTALLGYLIYGDHGSYSPAGGTTVGRDTSFTDGLGVVRAAHYFNLGQLEALVEVLQPFGTLSDARIGGVRFRDSSGFGDTTVAAAIWPVNRPSSQTYVGLAMYLTVPDGAYSRDQAINLGGNRLVYNPELALHQGFGGHWSIDVSGDVLAYGDNSSAGPVGSPTFSEHPTIQLQGFLNYAWTPRLSSSIAYESLLGGRQFLDGVAGPGKTESQEIRFIGSYAMTKTTQILGEVNHQFQTVGGFRQDVGITIRGLLAF
ncbi:MAG: transporter [Janthinobacterium lividum]